MAVNLVPMYQDRKPIAAVGQHVRATALDHTYGGKDGIWGGSTSAVTQQRTSTRSILDASTQGDAIAQT